MLETKTVIRLQSLEKQLNQAIRVGNFPFLGHYSHFFYDALKTSITSELSQSNRALTFYLDCLNRWPAVFATYLVHHVAEGYGARGNFEVYPYIEKALYAGLNNKEREALWADFRAACVRLGLSVSPRKSGNNYMIEEYLRQAGVPLNYLDELVERMIKYSESAGLPDDDDPEAIRLWSQGLHHHIRYLSKPVQKAIEADSEGFYIRLFVKAVNGQLSRGDDVSEIERRLTHAVELVPLSGRIRKKTLAIPRVVFRDSQLGVELPASEESVWKIDLADTSYEYLGSPETKFVPINSPLPPQISISDLKGSSHVTQPLWVDSQNNRLLVFSDSGSFVGSGQLGQEHVFLLEPGEYNLLLRFAPSGLEEECLCLSDSPELFSFRLSLDPAQMVDLKRGPAKVSFLADTKPAMVWEGQKIRGVQGNELYASHGLSLDVKIPAELFFDETVKYVVTLNPGEIGELTELPITAAAGAYKIDLSEHFLKWRPGLTRLLVELKREGFQRAEARSSIFLWNGLERVTNRTRFHCSRLPSPANLLLSECDNVKIDHESNVVTYKNEDQRLFRMIFQASQSRKQPFTWSVPGIFLQILDYQEQITTEKPVKKGSTLSVSTRSRELLEIFSSNNGALQLGTFNKPVNFDQIGRVRIPLAGLVEYLGPGADVLSFVDQESQVPEDLLRLVAPHQILEFQVTYHSDKVVLRFSTKEEVALVALNIKDMISGRKKECTLICDSSQVQGDGGFSFWLSCQKTENNICQNELQLFLENWPNGAWVITFEGRIKGRWGRFSNARSDHFALGVPVIENHICRGADASWKSIKELDEAHKEIIFKRIHRKLLNCYAPQSWESIDWLGALWTKLVAGFAAEGVPRKRVITLAEELQDESNAPSWVPLYAIISKCPTLYSQTVSAYQKLPNPRQALSIKCLNVLADMKFGVLPLLLEGVVNGMLAFAFSNPMEMQEALPPKNFSLDRFGAVLKAEDISSKLKLLRQHEWQPGDGDYLGALHYHFAEEQLQQNFRASMVGNEYRRGKALNLCRHMQTIKLGQSPAHLTAGTGVLDLSDTVYDEEYQAPVEDDHLQQITRFLSHFARACRWELRHPGTLSSVRDQAIKILGKEEDYELVLGYLLYLGKDLFMFYLMLWEAAFKADVDNLEVS